MAEIYRNMRPNSKKTISKKRTVKKESPAPKTHLLQKVNNLPKLPGVYLMKNTAGNVIYIGKAASLRKRVKSYFAAAPRDSRTLSRFLVPKVRDVDFIVTNSEKEALILENTLIKKHKPKYNINLKDDKTYYSLKVNIRHKYPRLLLTRSVKHDKSLYFGPYSSSAAVRDTITLLRGIFKLRTCSDSQLKNRARACLNYQINQCSAPCMRYISADEYKSAVDSVVLFLNGDTASLIRNLTKRMKEFSDTMDFEAAARIRDQIKAIKVTVEKQRVVTHKKGQNNDIIGAYKEDDDISVTVINVRGGSIMGLKNHVFLINRLSMSEVVSSFIKQYYHKEREIPREVLISNDIDDLQLIVGWLSERRGNGVGIRVPSKGQSKRIVEMALENAKQSLLNKRKLKDDINNKLQLVKEKLHLKNVPRIIECYDISNISGKLAVGSKVVLKDGAFDKGGYRRYRIKIKTEADDYGMMYEVLQRRLVRIEADGERPDLLLIDGGKGHLGVARRVLADLDIKGVDVVSLAKERRQRNGVKEERVYIPNQKNPIVISGLGAAFNILITLRDEAHRFAITYHKKVRGKSAIASIFDSIKGIGPKKKGLILAHINSLTEITKENLEQLKGLTNGDIANILEEVKGK